MEAAEVIVAEEIVEAVVEPCPDCPVNNGNVSFAMGNDITTAYYFRGLMQENKGFITQPWMEVGFTLWEAADQDAFISDIALVLGNWNSVQSEQTGSTPGTGAGNWYEADLYAGLSLGLSHGFSVGATYVAYTSPSGAFGTLQEIDVNVAYDDSSLYSGKLAELGFSVQPYVLFAFELDKGLGCNGTCDGIYMELGLEPSIELASDSDYPVTLGVPVTIGLSLDDYYYYNGDNDVFGYATIGVSAGVPLSFIPAKFGSTSAGVNVSYLGLGDDAQYNYNGGESKEWIGTLSLNWEY